VSVRHPHVMDWDSFCEGKIAILGAGGLAKELFWNIRDVYPEMDFWFVDDTADRKKRNLKIKDEEFGIIRDWSFPTFDSKFLKQCDGKNIRERLHPDFLVGVGDPKIKKLLVKKALDAGLIPADTFIHPRAMAQDAEIGVGGSFSAGSYVTANIKIGDYVTLNGVLSIGHDSVIGDYTTINPGVSISGNVKIGEGCVIGSGTVIKEGLELPPGTITGAQAAVVKPVEGENKILVGVPAIEHRPKEI